MCKKGLYEWVTEEAVANSQVLEMASDDRMVILELSGNGVFCESIPETKNAVSLLIISGNLSFQRQGGLDVIPGPAYVDFIFAGCWKDIKTSDDFKGYLMMTEQIFFQIVVEKIRFNMSDIIYKYVQNPFVSLDEYEVERMLLLVGLLADVVNSPGSRFRDETMRALLQTLLFSLWNVISHIYPEGTDEECPFWKDVTSRFLHLVRTNCRQYHEVKWYATQLCVSPDSLSAKLRKQYGKSASQMIDEILSEDAKSCLTDEYKTIQEVAEMLGFSDQAAFGKFFKRCCGMSPGMFRKNEKFMK